jgi:hypothetical protein
MASNLGSLLDAVKSTITDHSDRQKHTGFDPSGLLNQISDLFGKHEAASKRDVRPASEDPYGDPADQTNAAGRGKVKPASEDPYGDPADEKRRA